MKPKNLRHRVILPFVFVTGVCAGALGMAALAKRASSTYLEMTRTQFVAEEERLLREAWQRDDIGGALVYAGSVLEVTHGKGTRAVMSDRATWPLAFPILAPFADAIMRPNITAKSLAANEAMSRALLGNTWERVGRVDLAKREFDRAAEIGGGVTAAQWKDAGIRLLEFRVPGQGRGTPEIPAEETPAPR